MKNAIKAFGIIALAALIGFSFAACGDDGGSPSGGGGGGNLGGGGGGPTGGGSLPAPTLSATAVSTTQINLSWTAVSGAAGYNVYASLSYSSGYRLLDSGMGTSTSGNNATPGTTYYFRVAAYDSIGTEGELSNVASATTQSDTPAPTLSGVWESDTGMQITVNGNTGVLTAVGSSALRQDAVDKGYLKIGDQYWRNLSSKGNLTWSGQHLGVNYNSSSPNVATGVQYANNCTWTLSENGQTLTVTGTNPADGGSFTFTYTRVR